MRGSLKGVLARVDRMAARLQPSLDGLAAQLKTMSDEDLEAFVVQQVEVLAGPADGFDTEDAYVEALCVTVPAERTKPTSYQEAARHHWRRLHWLQDHTAHGTVAHTVDGVASSAGGRHRDRRVGEQGRLTGCLNEFGEAPAP